jgi:hypothetical protein
MKGPIYYLPGHGGVLQKGLGCWRRLNFDHLCRLNLDQGLLLV